MFSKIVFIFALKNIKKIFIFITKIYKAFIKNIYKYKKLIQKPTKNLRHDLQKCRQVLYASLVGQTIN